MLEHAPPACRSAMSKRQRKVAFVDEVDVEDKRRRGQEREAEETGDAGSNERSQLLSS